MSSVRRRYLLSSVAMLDAYAAHAQTTPRATDTSAAAPDTSTEIVVTGSRIARPDYEASNPIVSFSAADLQK